MIENEVSVVTIVELSNEMKRVFKLKCRKNSNCWITMSQAISFIMGKGYNKTKSHLVLNCMVFHRQVTVDLLRERVVLI